MAVKPINKQVVHDALTNRAEHISTKNLKDRSGNSEHSVVPGKDLTNNYAITLKDVDTSIIKHIKDVMRPTIKEANESFKVPIMYGNEERWKAVRKNGVMRDKNNSLLLPLVMLKRTDIAKNNLSGQGMEHDVKGTINYTRTSKWSKDNRYDRFSVLQGQTPTYEQIVTGVPDFADITYQFILWTNYIEHMNVLVEDFMAQSNKYWGDSTDYKFLSTIDDITDASEMEVTGERFIKSEFNLIVKAYLLPEYINSVVTNKTSNLRKQLTTAKVIFGYEGDATDAQVKK